jgi:hypothetical protein
MNTLIKIIYAHQLKVENDFLAQLPGLNLTGRKNGK